MYICLCPFPIDPCCICLVSVSSPTSAPTISLAMHIFVFSFSPTFPFKFSPEPATHKCRDAGCGPQAVSLHSRPCPLSKLIHTWRDLLLPNEWDTHVKLDAGTPASNS